MKRRGFLAFLGAAPIAAVSPAEGLSRVADAAPGTRHFAVLMNLHGQPVHTMMVENLPQEIHIQHENHDMTCEFRLVSKDRYDGRTIEGLARYIQWKGPIPASWGTIKLGL